MLKFLSFGEVLWDVIGGVEYLGGAPLNFLAHSKFFDVDGYLVSSVGSDDRGERILNMMNNFGISANFVQKDSLHPTGWVDVFVSNDGQPVFTIHKDVAFDFCEYTDSLRIFLEKQTVDCFYFGTLAQRNEVSRSTLFRILDGISAREIFYDVNIRQNFYSSSVIVNSLKRATIVKCNEDEFGLLANLLYPNQSLDFFVKSCMNDYPIKIIIVTKGDKGCDVYSNDKMFSVPGIEVKVADTVGAGDAFSAGFLSKYLKTDDAFISAMFGNRIGAYVASQSGAIPSDVDKYRKFINTLN